MVKINGKKMFINLENIPKGLSVVGENTLHNLINILIDNIELVDNETIGITKIEEYDLGTRLAYNTLIKYKIIENE